VDEIEHLLTYYGVSRISIADDLFTANKQRVSEFCNEINQRRIKFEWGAFARVNTVDIDILRIMRDAGCDAVSFGIESGSPEMLKRVKKGITLDQARVAVKYCKEVGIIPHASFMVGLPGESHQTLQDSRDFAEELDIAYGYHMLAPFPGTTVVEDIDQYDLEILTYDWDRYDANRAVVRTSALSNVEMDEFIIAVEKCYESVWNDIVKRYQQNQCTPYEALRVEGDRRMRLIFRLLSEDLIAEAGSFPKNDHNPTNKLVNNIMSLTGIEADFAHKTIQSLIDKGYLKFKSSDGHINWYWTHNTHVDRLFN